MATWTELLPEASNQRTLVRAFSVVGKNTLYKLGAGGFNPVRPLGGESDCSGFVAWALGIPRELPPRSGKWLSTDQFWAGGKGVLDGLCSEVPRDQARPGDIYVYPDYKGQDGRKREGHIAIITQVENGRATKVVHCSTGSYKKFKDAIRETDPTVFEKKANARVMRIDYERLRRAYGPEAMPAPAPSSVLLRHPLLRDDLALQAVASGRRAIEPAAGRVPGVAAVQDALNLLARTHPAYAVDVGANRQYSGYFGPRTVQAVRSFQADQGLQVDGVIGRNTLRKLDEALAGLGG